MRRGGEIQAHVENILSEREIWSSYNKNTAPNVYSPWFLEDTIGSATRGFLEGVSFCGDGCGASAFG